MVRDVDVMGGRRRADRFALATGALAACIALFGCSGGSSGSGSGGCAGECAQPAGLSSAEVQLIVARGVAEAQANGVEATIAVVDRVGNVLAVAQTNPAVNDIRIDGGRGAQTGLDGLTTAAAAGLGVTLDARLAAISKAGTGAYLSSQGNAFSTRTASQIVQENFNPGERFRAGGPLFGVQFSQLPCGDFVRSIADGTPGPKRLPLGFAADPGGLPLYKPDPSGVGFVPVGGVGVESDGVYGLDPAVVDLDTSLDERIATAAASGHAAPADRRADRIAVDGRFLRFADDEATRTPPGAILPTPTPGATLVAVPGFYAGVDYLPGQTFLTPASGIAPDALLLFTDPAGNPIPFEVIASVGDPNLYDPIASASPLPAAGGMTQNEVTILLRETLRVANHTRGQIRRPQGSTARVNISVVDLGGNLLGFIRTADAPVFGADVSLQKARTAAFFSRADAAAILGALAAPPVPPLADRFQAPAVYLAALQALIPGALSNGTAFSDRAGGNLARPFFPDGINGNPNGPLSRPTLSVGNEWSIFSTGLQLDASAANLIRFLAGGNPTQCPESPIDSVDNGFQIFPGSVPIYRGGQLVGGIGISGDGVDQDDLVGFLGLHNASLQPGVGIGNAPGGIRADVINVNGIRLRYVSCPPSPFTDSDAQNVCEGK